MSKAAAAAAAAAAAEAAEAALAAFWGASAAHDAAHAAVADVVDAAAREIYFERYLAAKRTDYAVARGVSDAFLAAAWGAWRAESPPGAPSTDGGAWESGAEPAPGAIDSWGRGAVRAKSPRPAHAPAAVTKAGSFARSTSMDTASVVRRGGSSGKSAAAPTGAVGRVGGGRQLHRSSGAASCDMMGDTDPSREPLRAVLAAAAAAEQEVQRQAEATVAATAAAAAARAAVYEKAGGRQVRADITEDAGVVYVSTTDYSEVVTPRDDPLMLTAGITAEVPVAAPTVIAAGGGGGDGSRGRSSRVSRPARPVSGTDSAAPSGPRPGSRPATGGPSAQFSGGAVLAPPAVPSRVRWEPRSPGEAAQAKRARSHWRLGGTPPREVSPVQEAVVSPTHAASAEGLALSHTVTGTADAAVPVFLVLPKQHVKPVPPPRRPVSVRPARPTLGDHRKPVRDRAGAPSPRSARLPLDEVEEIRAAAAVSPRQHPHVETGVVVAVKSPLALVA